MSFYFGDKTRDEIAQAAAQNTVIVLPVGTTEEHGSHYSALFWRCTGESLRSGPDSRARHAHHRLWIFHANCTQMGRLS